MSFSLLCVTYEPSLSRACLSLWFFDFFFRGRVWCNFLLEWHVPLNQYLARIFLHLSATFCFLLKWLPGAKRDCYVVTCKFLLIYCLCAIFFYLLIFLLFTLLINIEASVDASKRVKQNKTKKFTTTNNSTQDLPCQWHTFHHHRRRRHNANCNDWCQKQHNKHSSRCFNNQRTALLWVAK